MYSLFCSLAHNGLRRCDAIHAVDYRYLSVIEISKFLKIRHAPLKPRQAAAHCNNHRRCKLKPKA